MADLLRRQASTLRYDLPASLVVFLVAMPLCVGVAVASGVPAERGLITGIVGGLVVGLLPGSRLQVSGPAAGLTVLVFEAVREYGPAALGLLVLAAGLIQIALGLLCCGRWFRAISVAVVHGMLAGIGLILVFGQVYSLADATAPESALGKIAGLPGLLLGLVRGELSWAAAAVGLGTIAVLVLWKRLPGKLGAVPAPLVAVVPATGAVAVLGLDVRRVEVDGLLAAVQLPSADALGDLASPAALGTVLALTVIASAESLFSAAAVDRMPKRHSDPGTDYDRELTAQGIGNTVCGLLGALPMTAVIVRSAANVQAGARSRNSRFLHGVWLLLFAALLPSVLGLVPVAALAGVLVHSGAKLVPVREPAALWRGREHRGEVAVLVATTAAIVAAGLFEGVLVGMGLAVVRSAWQTSRLRVDVADGAETLRVRLSGHATFLRLPRLLDALESLPPGRAVVLDWSELRYVDHACASALQAWVDQRDRAGGPTPRVNPPLAKRA